MTSRLSEIREKEILKKERKRIEKNKTGFLVRGFTFIISDNICVMVDLNKNQERQYKQKDEIVSLGYKPLYKKPENKRKTFWKPEGIYIMPISKLLEMHNIG